MIIPRSQGRRGIFFFSSFVFFKNLAAVTNSVTIFITYLCKQVLIFIIELIFNLQLCNELLFLLHWSFWLVPFLIHVSTMILMSSHRLSGVATP